MQISKRLSVFLAVLMTALFINCAYASSSDDDQVFVKTGNVSNDLYLAKETIFLDALVEGDLLAAGENVSVKGKIMGDLIVAGANLVIATELLDDARLVGASIDVCSSVSGDVTMAGADIMTCAEAVFAGPVYAAGKKVNLAGNFKGKTLIRAKTVNLAGTFVGDIDINAESIELLPTAVIQGNLSYASPEQLKQHAASQILGQKKYTEVKNGWWDAEESLKKPPLIVIVLSVFGVLISGLITALTLNYFFAESISDIVDEIRPQALRNIGFGVLCLLFTPLVIVALMLSVIGIPLALFLIFSYLLFLLTVSYTHLLFVADVLYGLVTKDMPKKFWTLCLSIVGAIITIIAISMIPLFGLPLIIILYCAAAGSTGLHIFQRIRQ